MEMLFFHAYYRWGVSKIIIPEKTIGGKPLNYDVLLYHSLGVSSGVIWGGTTILENPHERTRKNGRLRHIVAQAIDF